jgi:hypothetical protein
MPIVKLPDGALRDEVRQPLYDTLVIQAAESPVGVRRFYSSVQGKTKAQSNMRQNNMLETAVSFRVLGIALDVQSYYTLNKQALPIIMENSSLRLRIGEKDYWEGNMTFLSGRISAQFSAATTVAATTVNDAYLHFGEKAIQPVQFTGRHVIDIPPLQSFFVEWICDNLAAPELALSTPAANTQLRYIFSLKGLLRRPVQ